MRTVSVTFNIPVRVIRNTSSASKGHQWAKIVDARNGQTLHTGQISYIRRVARKRYNVTAAL